ncbi:MAG TPA: hypothetical protein VMU29_02440 [Smithella sp.]|nr:hypothetical protein [Smithella sp.]
MPTVISKNPIRIKTRVEIRSLILNSGLFKVETKNGVQIPRGVYRLHKTENNLTEKIMANVKAHAFFCSLDQILVSYQNRYYLNANTENEIEGFADDELNDYKKYFIDRGFSESEINKYFPFCNQRFKNLIKKKIVESGIFKHNIKRLQMYYKLYDPLIKAFQKYIYKDKKTEDIIYHHMAPLLINCKIIDQSDSKKAYQKIRKDIYRVRSNSN